MYIEHPYKYDGKYYANVDGKMIEITKEVAYAMNNFYRSSQPRKVEIKNEKGESVEWKLREIPYSETNGQDYEFSIEDFPDYSCDVEDSVISSVERRDIHKVINQLDAEERMIIYSIYFENKTQVQLAGIMGVSRQVLAYKLKTILHKMRRMYQENIFEKSADFCIRASRLNLVIRESFKDSSKAHWKLNTQ